MEMQVKHTTPAREARAAILAGQPVPARVAAALEAQGVDVGALEQRIRQSREFQH